MRNLNTDGSGRAVVNAWLPTTSTWTETALCEMLPAFSLDFLECVICRSGFHKTGSVLWDITPTFTPLLLVSVRGSEMLHYHKNPDVLRSGMTTIRLLGGLALFIIKARLEWHYCHSGSLQFQNISHGAEANTSLNVQQLQNMFKMMYIHVNWRCLF